MPTSASKKTTFNAGAWTASGALAAVYAQLAGVTFNPALNFNGNCTISSIVSDGALSVRHTFPTRRSSDLDAPTATNLNAAETYTEDTPLNLTDIVVSDVDSAN